MFIKNWLRALTNDSAARTQSIWHHNPIDNRDRRRASRVLAVERLEGRALLTAYLVDTLADDPSAPAGNKDQQVSLREAITAANTNAVFGDAAAGQASGVIDTIAFHHALSGKTIVLGGTELTINGTLSITGLGQDSLSISGAGASRVFRIEPGIVASISDVSIVNGFSYIGAGIYNLGELTLTDTTFSYNRARQDGGGVANIGTMTVTQSSLVHNQADVDGDRQGYGGAIANLDASAVLTVADSNIKVNSAQGGGGIENRGELHVAASSISANLAKSGGGGIRSIPDPARPISIVGSTITDNTTEQSGGGILTTNGTLTIVNTTISGNSARLDGGGIQLDWSPRRSDHVSLALINSTLVQNRADLTGADIGDGGSIRIKPNTAASLQNSLIAGNVTGAVGSDTPDDISGDNTNLSGTHNLIGDAGTSGGLIDGDDGNIVGNNGVGTIDITSVIDTNLADNGGPTLTHALVAESLAIDAGDNGNAVDMDGLPLPNDQRGDGFDRIAGDVVDIGAFEVQPPALPVEIDVKPGSDPNSINLASKGLVAVAIFATDDFDVADINVSSVVWAGANVAQRNDGSYFSALEDVDGDGDLDLVLHFRLVETNLLAVYEDLLRDDLADGTLDSHWQSVDIALEGLTNDGGSFVGFDSLDLFLIGKALRDFRDQRGI